MLLTGALVMTRRVGAEQVEINRTDYRGVVRRRGAVLHRRPDRPDSTAPPSAPPPTRRSSRCGRGSSRRVFRAWYPMAVHLLQGLFLGQQNTASVIGQRERLLALGKLSAGLTHELNNPAAAAGRAAHDLRDRVAGMRHKLAMIADGAMDRTQLKKLVLAAGRVRREGPPRAGPHAAADLGRRGRAHRLARRPRRPGRLAARPDLRRGRARRGRPRGRRTRRARTARWRARCAGWPTRWRPRACSARSSTRRSGSPTLVNAAKQYSQMDRAPHQWLDLHEGLFATLTMLKPKLGGITSGQGARQVAAAHPGLPRRAEPGVDQPDRQRPRRHGRLRAR